MSYVTPQGFRDVLTDEALMREQITYKVQQLLASRGYAPIETPTLEHMDVMRAGGHVPGTPFKLFDSAGKLLAMRPDVTLQVARMCSTRLANQEGPFRFRYTQRVFREAEGQMQAEAREVTQLGVELVGIGGPEADAEMVELLAECLEAVGVSDYRIAVATVGVLKALLASTAATDEWREGILAAYHASNFVELDELTEPATARAAGVSPVFANAIRELPRIRGGREAISRVRELVKPLACEDGLDSLESVLDALAAVGLADRMLVDFSVMSSFDYYTGIIFKAYAAKVGTPLGGGGRYDATLAAYGKDRPAAGFAFYLENAMASAVGLTAAGDVAVDPAKRPLRIAVPKGSLNADCVACLKACGLDTADLDNPGRQMIIRGEGVEYIIVRPSDAPAFVESGAADCGICGEDSLLETMPDIVELVDLKFGACRFIVAEPAGSAEANEEHYRRLGSIRVATKYPNIAAQHFARRGTQVEIVKLHGNIELAPLIGMAECIVDITATGTTLRENNLVITDEVMSSTARFFANVSAFRTNPRVVELAEKLQGGVAAGKWGTTVIAGGAQ